MGQRELKVLQQTDHSTGPNKAEHSELAEGLYRQFPKSILLGITTMKISTSK